MGKRADGQTRKSDWGSLALLVAFMLVPVPVLAARKMSVEQLQQLMAAAQTQHRADGEVTRELANVRLTERLSTPVLEKLIAASPGAKTTQSLHFLADAAIFLDPPANEIPAQPPPSVEEQRAMVAQTAHYVARMLPTLPNFVATRVVDQLVDAQQLAETEHPEALGGMFRVNTYRTPIAVRDGKETDDPAMLAQAPVMKQSSFGSKPNGMTSQGEFGPILLIVLVDAAKGKMSWARWENTGGTQLAVYRFSVDKPVSHFQLFYSPRNSQDINGYSPGTRFNSNRIRAPHSAETLDVGAVGKPHFVGYHGLLSIDPATGAIMRIVVEADWKPGDEMQKPSMMVEYGQVKIGDGTYICPKHSVAMSVFEESYQLTPSNPEQTVNATHLNDVEFTGYRRFGSDVKLVTGDSGDTADAALPRSETSAAKGGSSAGNGATEATSVTASIGSNAAVPTPNSSDAAPNRTAAAQADSAVVPAVADTSRPPSIASSAVPAVAPSSTPEARPAPAESDHEFLIRAVDAMPGMGDVTVDGPDSASGASGNGMNFNIKVATRLVDLGLVITDKRGKPITDLKQDEIEVDDNGRKVQLVLFHPAVIGASAAAQAQEPSDTFTNAPQTGDVAGQESPEMLILLLDESHLAFADLNRARQEVLRFLKASRPNARIALYALNEQGFRILQDVTQDHALVMASLAAWTPTARAVAQGQALDRRNRQQFDTVHNPEDLNHVNGNNIQTPDGVTTSDPELRQMGANPLRSALESMTALARHFATVPGHKSLAWISGDSALADFQNQAVGIDKGTPVMQGAFQHTREALNEAHIALYAVDASNVEGGGVDPSLANSSVQLDQTSAALSDPNRVATGHISGARSSAQMQQDTHGIQTSVRQLAEATGGRAISKGSDLKAALDGIEQEAGAFYEIGFDPDGAADGKYHNLQVKVAGRKDVKLRYRSGYLYNEVSTDTTQRMQQMIWSPQDATGVAFTVQAFPADAAGAGNVKLRISFPGIALEKHDDRWTDQLYIFVAQRDEATQQADVSGETLGLSLKQATYDSGLPAGIPYRHAVAPKSKFGSVRVIVVDSNSGKMGTVTVPYSALRAQ